MVRAEFNGRSDHFLTVYPRWGYRPVTRFGAMFASVAECGAGLMHINKKSAGTTLFRQSPALFAKPWFLLLLFPGFAFAAALADLLQAFFAPRSTFRRALHEFRTNQL